MESEKHILERNKRMSVEKVKKYLKDKGYLDRVMEFDISSATVELAAIAVGCEPAQIAKTMSFIQNDGPVLIVAAGDTKVDNKKYKGLFHQKAKMIPGNEVEALIGHAPGGVCPFGILSGIRVFLDESLKRFEIVYPAAGSSNSAVRITPEELEKLVENSSWVDVTSIKEI